METGGDANNVPPFSSIDTNTMPSNAQGTQKRKFSTTPINERLDRQLSRQKIRQKISVIKTNSVDWELLTFDDIKK